MQELTDYMSTSINDYSPGYSIYRGYREKLDQHRNNIAFILDDRNITYDEFNKIVNKYINLLYSYKLNQGARIAVYSHRSHYTIALSLAIYAIGCVYIPIDETYPEERVKYILYNSECSAIIYSNKKLIFPNIISIDMKNYNTFSSELCVQEKYISKAYIIYTSGTTGYPKGAMISHKNIIPILYEMKKALDINEDDILAYKTSISFTDAIFEQYLPLFIGCKIRVFNDTIVQNPVLLLEDIIKYNITIIQLVPSLLSILVETEKHINMYPLKLRWVINGGEYLSPVLSNQWIMQNSSKIFNVYGMTECSSYSSYYIIDKIIDEENMSVPLGFPFNGVQISINDGNLEKAKINTIGEIYISGIGVGEGYWKNYNETKEKFVYIDSQRNYKTGDLGYINDNGMLYYAGRKDDQVKIKGIRIELAEVEKNVKRILNTNYVVVLVEKDAYEENYLICFYVSNIIEKDLFEILREQVPEYLIPQKLIKLNSFPLTEHGKFDRKKLRLMNNKFIQKQNTIDSDRINALTSLLCKIIDIRNAEELKNSENMLINSLNKARLVIELENLGIEIDFDYINTEIKSVKDLVDFLKINI